jgi:hypothetical protein
MYVAPHHIRLISATPPSMTIPVDRLARPERHESRARPTGIRHDQCIALVNRRKECALAFSPTSTITSDYGYLIESPVFLETKDAGAGDGVGIAM